MEESEKKPLFDWNKQDWSIKLLILCTVFIVLCLIVIGVISSSQPKQAGDNKICKSALSLTKAGKLCCEFSNPKVCTFTYSIPEYELSDYKLNEARIK